MGSASGGSTCGITLLSLRNCLSQKYTSKVRQSYYDQCNISTYHNIAAQLPLSVMKLPTIIEGVHHKEGRLDEGKNILSHKALPRFLGFSKTLWYVWLKHKWPAFSFTVCPSFAGIGLNASVVQRRRVGHTLDSSQKSIWSSPNCSMHYVQYFGWPPGLLHV